MPQSGVVSVRRTVGNDQKSNNRSGFTVTAGGYVNWVFQVYQDQGLAAYFWSPSGMGTGYDWVRILSTSDDEVYSRGFRRGGNQPGGFSVRCEKDGLTKPVARFTISPPAGVFTTTFLFDASDCTDNETAAEDLEVRWDWDGDGIWDTGYDTIKTISHQYTSPGSYMVILEVKNEAGLLSSKNKIVIAGEGTFTDNRDGREYSLITIGTQIWMAENLAYLPSVGPSSGGYSVYGYFGSDISKAKSTDNYSDYGVLYNWPAAKMACPAGWHLPVDKEWTTLTGFLADSQGSKMKGPSTAVKWSPHTSTANVSGFTALPGGSRDDSGGFIDIGIRANFWSASTYSDNYGYNAWSRSLDNGNGVVRD